MDSKYYVYRKAKGNKIEHKLFQYSYENQWKISLCSHNMWDHSSVPLHYSVTLDDMGYPLIREVIMKWPFYPLRGG